MTSFTCILVLLFCSCVAIGQGGTATETEKVFSYLLSKKNGAFLSMGIDTSSFNAIHAELAKNHFIRRITKDGTLHIDTLSLSGKERKYLDSALANLAAHPWTTEEMNRNGLAWLTLIDEGGTTRNPDFNFVVYNIMKPVFLRNHTIAFVYYYYTCGSLCGHGALSILIKRDGNWQTWWTIFNIDS